MADDDTSEEKKHDATDRKLDKQREKGSVPQSNETLMAVASVVGLVYLFWTLDTAREFSLIFFEMGEVHNDADFDYALKKQLYLMMELIMLYTVPMMLVITIIGVGINIYISDGFVFSTEPMKPDFNRFNPVEGFKKIFGLKAMKVFGMHMVRLIIIGAIVIAITYYFLPVIAMSSSCGLGCGVSANYTIYLYIFAVFCAISLLFAVFDFMIHKQQFLEDAKMTETEMKQERKEQHGTPEVKQRQKEIRNEAAEQTVGLKYVDFILADSLKFAIGIHYDRDGDDPPAIVAKSRNSEGVSRLITLTGKPVENAPEILSALSTLKLGDTITEDEDIELIVPYLQKYT